MTQRPAPRRPFDVLGRLYVVYHTINEEKFAGLLPLLPIYLDPNLCKGKVGQVGRLVSDGNCVPRYIQISSTHALHDSWASVRDTLLHEMVHVWQAARGDTDTTHNRDFKRIARRIGCQTRSKMAGE